MREITNCPPTSAQSGGIRKPAGFSGSDRGLTSDDPDSLRRHLAEINPSGTLSVELPFQVRTNKGFFCAFWQKIDVKKLDFQQKLYRKCSKTTQAQTQTALRTSAFFS